MRSLYWPWTSPTILTGGDSSTRVGCERKTSRAAWQMAVISAFFRHTDLVTLPE